MIFEPYADSRSVFEAFVHFVAISGRYLFIGFHDELRVYLGEEAKEKIPPPARDDFIDSLKVSPELSAWLKNHDTFDLTSPDVDKLLTPEDILHVPEFLLAYQRSNSGGVTAGLPKPKYTEADRTQHPEKYEKLKQDYMTALL